MHPLLYHLSTLPSFTISHPQVETPGVLIEELSEEEVLPEPGHFLRYLFPGGPLHAEDAPPPREPQEGPPAEDALPSQAGPCMLSMPRGRLASGAGASSPCSLPGRRTLPRQALPRHWAGQVGDIVSRQK